jgi:hypothetical protein
MTKTYNRQDGETTKAYTAFTIYRDMGSARSLDRVEEKIYGTQIGHKRGTNITSLKRWSREWNWVDRCRDYDLDREQDLRMARCELEKAQYLEDLENYHVQQKAIGMTALRFAIDSIESISLSIEPIRQKITLYQSIDSKEWDLFCQAQVAAKNVMAIAVSGAEIAARGLMLEQILESIEGEIEARSRSL